MHFTVNKTFLDSFLKKNTWNEWMIIRMLKKMWSWISNVENCLNRKFLFKKKKKIVIDKADGGRAPERNVRKWFLPDRTQGLDVPGLGVSDFLDCANVMFPELAAKARVPIYREGQQN